MMNTTHTLLRTAFAAALCALSLQTAHVCADAPVSFPWSQSVACATSPSGVVVGATLWPGTYPWWYQVNSWACILHTDMKEAGFLSHTGQPASRALCVSPDGNYAGGTICNWAYGLPGGALWDIRTGMLCDSGPLTVVRGISMNAGRVVGAVGDKAASYDATGVHMLSTASKSEARAVSYDGQVIVGSTGMESTARATVWTSAGELLLPLPPGRTNSLGLACSADGSVIVGYSFTGYQDCTFTRWAFNATSGQYVPLEIGETTPWGWPWFWSNPPIFIEAASSPDGSVVSGGFNLTPIVWSQSAGILDLNAMFASLLSAHEGPPGEGYTVTAYIWQICGICSDNRTLIGNASLAYMNDLEGAGGGGIGNYGCRIVLPAPNAPAADLPVRDTTRTQTRSQATSPN